MHPERYLYTNLSTSNARERRPQFQARDPTAKMSFFTVTPAPPTPRYPTRNASVAQGGRPSGRTEPIRPGRDALCRGHGVQGFLRRGRCGRVSLAAEWRGAWGHAHRKCSRQIEVVGILGDVLDLDLAVSNFTDLFASVFFHGVGSTEGMFGLW